MSALGERTVVLLLTDTDSLHHLIRDGMPVTCIPTPALRPIVEWARNYFGKTSVAPSIEIMKERFGPVLDDNQIDMADDVEETIEWGIDALKQTAVQQEVGKFSRRLALEVTQAAPENRLETLEQITAELSAFNLSLQPKTNSIDFRHSGLDILADYDLAKVEGVRGMCFGIPEVDQHLGGIWPGELVTVAGAAGTGKAQPLETPVLTPWGWKAMGEIQVGDLVVGRDGKETRVRAIHPQGSIPTYRVEISDGTTTECSGDHLWDVQNRDQRQKGLGFTTRSTEEIIGVLARGRDRDTYLPVVAPVEHPISMTQHIHPYALGLLLGDGGFTGPTPTFTKDDEELHQSLISRMPGARLGRANKGTSRIVYSHRGGSAAPNPLKSMLFEMGLWGQTSLTKFIPEGYMIGSIKQRAALLQGLMDTDGWVTGGSVCYGTSSMRLAAQVGEIVRSLGGTATVSTKIPRYQGGDGSRAWTLTIRLPEQIQPFRLPRKADAWRRLMTGGQRRRPGPARRIVSIERVEDKESQCITVEAEDGLYVTEGHLVTHNSFFANVVAHREWMRGRVTTLFTLENTVSMARMRVACCALNIDIEKFQTGELDEQQEAMLREWVNDVLINSDTPLHIINPEVSGRSPQALVQSARAFETESLIVDQLTFVEPVNTHTRERHNQVSEIVRTLATAIQSGRDPLPCLLLHQVNREGIKASASSGQVSMVHMAESAEVERASTAVLALYQSDEMRQIARMQLQMLKQRRVKPKHWELDWHPYMGLVDVHQEVSFDGIV